MLCATAAALLGSTLLGCRPANHDAGSKLPVVPADSRALPGSVNSADAPEAPRVQTSTGEIASFRDPGTGISFRYPANWRPLVAGGPLLPPSFTENVGPALGTQAFTAAGTPLATTDLVGVSFGWTVKSGIDASKCASFAADALPMGTELPPETINGVPFNRGSGGDSGMCHHASATLDTTWHAGKCYLFERDLETKCPDIQSQGADTELTARQRDDLNRQLDRVMASVVLR